MLSENKLTRKTIGADSQTYKDYQDTSDNDTLYNSIGYGLAAITTYKLYKGGYLKEIAKPLLELADQIAREGTDKAGMIMHTVKQWSNLKHLTPEQLAASRFQKYNAPTMSLFRQGDTSLLYDVFEDFTNLSNSRVTNFHNIRQLMEGTKQDMQILQQMIKDNQEGFNAIKTNYLDTELNYRIKEMLNFEATATQVMKNKSDSIVYTKQAMEEFMKVLSLSSEKAAQELKESGYRKLTLGDVAELVKEDGVPKLIKKAGVEIDIDARTNEKYESLLENATNFFNNTYHRYGDKNARAFAGDDWKNIIIDSNMRISESGHIIDYRMTRNNAIEFSHSLANDFKLPLVQFNPFKTLLGFDKIGRRQPLMGLLSSNQYDPNITKLGGRSKNIGEWLVDTFGEEYRDKNVAVINGKAFVTDTNGKLQELGSGFKLHDITYADENYGLKPLVNASRQIAGLDIGSPDRSKAKYKITDWLDLGYQEIHIDNDSAPMGIDSATSVDEFTNRLLNKVTDKPYMYLTGYSGEYSNVQDMLNDIERRTYRSAFGEGFDNYTVNGKTITPRMFTTSKEGYKINTAYNHFKNGDKDAAFRELEGFTKQYVVGRDTKTNEMNEFFTERSGAVWSVFNQLSEGLGGASKLLGLSVDSKSSSVSLLGNLLIKRALPVYALTKIPEMINYMSEPFFGSGDETGNRDNITKVLMRGVVKPIDIAAHNAMDLFGATRLFKFLGEMVPGSDQINELPGIYQLGLGQTAEEREEYIENGYDPIRKGRWWGSGNTPFTGGKIMYFRPNIYRRVQADVDFSDSKWGSRQEYYNNTWFPNPVNPLAPLNHFIFDRNHYDKKHYYDRPYLQTAPVGQHIPVIGPLFSSTIGTIISPPQKMHLEYWQNGFQINPDDELPSSLLTTGTLDNSEYDINTFNKIEQSTAAGNATYQNALYTSAYQAKQVTSKTFMDKSGITFEQRSILPIRTYDRYDTPYEVYSTPSGSLNVVDVPDEMNLYNVNQDLQRYSINKVLGTNQRVNITNFSGSGIPIGNDSPSIDNAFVYGLGEQYNWLSDVAGLKGFALQNFITGEANQRARIIEDSGYAYSFNNDFWEENLGGLGGGLSEIARRFIPKRNNNTEYVNPIRNTMPSWMPGSTYFTDFKHGDPYSKIDNGEERLPGEGYERLHDIKGLMEFNIGSSSIGYEKDYIIKHMLKADKYMSTFEEDTLEKGNEIHKAIEKSWLEAGLAIEIEGKVEDKRNGIIGWYDAKVHDMSSPTGVAIVDIKSTSAKKLNEIRKSGQPLTHHMRQTNYYLWATGNTQSKGYIHYIDKEDPTNTYTVGFNYSQKELETTLKNVYDARKTIRDAVKRGEIGRGELYDTLDRFRILADVAPYSQEFKDVSAQLSSEDLSPEEQEEAAQIRERVSQQKEPLRVYPYKFKTSNLKSETVTVAKIIDNNTIVTKEYGKKHSVKFAGINVSMSNSEMFNDKYTKDEAARKAIRRYIRPGAKIRISYDADEHNKYSKDSTRSIRAVVYSNGQNVNKMLLNKGHATEKEDDDSPAGIQARYTKGEIAFGSAMERLTHDVISNIPFVGSKFLQVRSPYEQYRKREVYGKDFQSWNNSVRDILIPHIEENIADNRLGGFGGILMGGFIGSLFGKSRFGKIVGTVVGATVPAIGKIAYMSGTTKDRDWRPKRRREQEKLNEYVDTLKYVKNMRLYNQYKTKALKENNFDVERFIESKESAGVNNKIRQNELTDYKRKVKLDFKHRDRYNFKYGKPKYVNESMSRKETISAINKEIAELQGQRKVTKVPLNALKAIEFKQAAEQTMYGYEPGDSLVNIMTALPKKERQYFKHFMDAPEEEKQKILRIAPSYLRRALQSTWGMPVDEKPSLQEYFQTHGLPDVSWVGWDESTNIEDVKVKLVHRNKLDPGEFDIWDSDEVQADATNIPIPMIDAKNNPREVQMKLNRLLGSAGYDDIQMHFVQSSTGNNTSLTVKRDARNDVSQQIGALNI